MIIFAKVNSFKNKHLNSYLNCVSINNSERVIKQLQDNNNFLKEQLKNKDEIINPFCSNYKIVMTWLFSAAMKKFNQIQTS